MKISFVFKILFFILFSFFFFLENPVFSDEGKLIFLLGTSSSGKSTLGKEFSKSNNNSVFFEHDKLWSGKEIALLKNKLGEKFNKYFATYGTSLIEMSFRNRNCVHVAQRIKECSLKNEMNTLLNNIKTVLGPQRKNLYYKTTMEIYNQVSKLIKNGKIILIDKIIDENDVKIFSKFNPVYVVVYYPFSKLNYRVQQRNNAAIDRKDSYDYRHYLEVYDQYMHLFCLGDSQTKAIIDSVEKKEAIAKLQAAYKLDIHYRDLKEFYILSDTFDINKYIDKFLNYFQLNKHDFINVQSKFGRDLVIRTDQLSAKEAARELSQFLLTQYPKKDVDL